MPSTSHTSYEPPIRSYCDLLVWQRAVDHCVDVYRLCRQLPRSEVYCLGSQLRRASVSVPSNIAEGHTRSHTGEFLQGLSTARGSLAEVETQLIIGVRVDLFPERTVHPLLNSSDEISRMLAGLMNRLRAAPPQARKTRNRRS